jgi:hypothetical protein
VTFEAVVPGEAGFTFLFINVFASIIVAYFALKFARKLIKVRA